MLQEQITDARYWDCECVKNYIHPKDEETCQKCGAESEEQPDSLVNEVIIFQNEGAI